MNGIQRVALIGLGRMGQGIAHRLLHAGFVVTGYDPSQERGQEAAALGVVMHETVGDAVSNVDAVWLMVPHGKPVDQALEHVVAAATPETIVIDGGNSHFADSARRAVQLAKHQLPFLDCGTSGGIHGAAHGFCLMIGGDLEAFTRANNLFEAVAAPEGFAHVGPSGAGHYVKMVHNGIEYGLLQAYAEGLMVLKEGSYKELDLAQITALWHNGAVIRSWLLELTHGVLQRDDQLEDISGAIQENKTGRWMADEAIKHQVPADMLEQALKVRAWSRETGGNYATKLVACLRNAFGGHPIRKIE